MRRAQRRAGFTLLELIVVIGIIGVVSGVGFYMFSHMLTTWTGLKSHTDLDRRAQWVLDDIGKDIAATISPSLVPDAYVIGDEYDPISGLGTDPNLGSDPGTAPNSDILILPVALPTALGGRTESGFANYRVFSKADADDVTEADTLVREIYSMDNEFAEAQRLNVAKGVKEFRVDFVGKDGKWSSDWSEENGGLPYAIRVSLTMADPDNPYRDRVTRMAVFPIQVD